MNRELQFSSHAIQCILLSRFGWVSESDKRNKRDALFDNRRLHDVEMSSLFYLMCCGHNVMRLRRCGVWRMTGHGAAHVLHRLCKLECGETSRFASLRHRNVSTSLKRLYGSHVHVGTARAPFRYRHCLLAMKMFSATQLSYLSHQPTR